MKALCLLIVYLLAMPCAARADEHGRVRPLDVWAAETLKLALERSATVRELVARIEASDVIVHVETRSVLPVFAAGTTRLAGTTASRRYVRIVVFRDPLPVSRVAVLGHELQHAWEIARSSARSAEDMRQLFTAIGRRSPGDQTVFETDAAIRVSRVVWFEVTGDVKNAARARRALQLESAALQ